MSSQVFREYIGAKCKNILFDNVPVINPGVDFHFILAFARDYDKNDNRTNGVFYPYWNTAHFNGATVDKIKRKYTNVKVIASIGGIDHQYPFNPEDKNSWVENAKESLTSIINDNNLDGIDINYSGILSNANVFSECIGRLIRELKDDNVINFASIAPSSNLQTHYYKLYKSNKDKIDLVNYQFYAESLPLDTVAKFNKAVSTQINEYYTNQNLLVGFSSDAKHSGKLPADVFFRGWQQLRNQLKGIFIWSADTSHPGYQYEKKAQQSLPQPN